MDEAERRCRLAAQKQSNRESGTVGATRATQTEGGHVTDNQNGNGGASAGRGLADQGEEPRASQRDAKVKELLEKDARIHSLERKVRIQQWRQYILYTAHEGRPGLPQQCD
jgi:hypothetical protein